jgi:hypothetical protein
MASSPPPERGREWVAIILASGLSLALCMLMGGVVWDAVRSDTPGLSENATQVVIAAFGGIIGVLGSYIGFRAAERITRNDRDAALEEVDERSE